MPRTTFYMAVVLVPALLITLLFLTTTASTLSAPPKPTYPNRIIFIRHAEKGFAQRPGLPPPPPPEWNAKNMKKGGGGWVKKLFGKRSPGMPRSGPPNGLSAIGKARAQFIRKLFGAGTEYDFGLIFAAPRIPKEKDSERTYATVSPLARDLSLEIDISCANSPASCVADLVREFAKTSDKDVLICWKHRELHVIATALGATNAQIHYPDERNDIIWIMKGDKIIEKRSMHCSPMDDERVDAGDPDLEIEESSSGGLLRNLLVFERS